MTFRMPRLATLAATAVAVALLTGCATETPAITPAPDPAVTPVFASDEEALAAAVEAYEAYWYALSEILEDAGSGEERIDEFATAEQAARDKADFAELRTSGN